MSVTTGINPVLNPHNKLQKRGRLQLHTRTRQLTHANPCLIHPIVPWLDFFVLFLLLPIPDQQRGRRAIILTENTSTSVAAMVRNVWFRRAERRRKGTALVSPYKPAKQTETRRLGLKAESCEQLGKDYSLQMTRQYPANVLVLRPGRHSHFSFD